MSSIGLVFLAFIFDWNQQLKYFLITSSLFVVAVSWKDYVREYEEKISSSINLLGFLRTLLVVGFFGLLVLNGFDLQKILNSGKGQLHVPIKIKAQFPGELKSEISILEPRLILYDGSEILLQSFDENGLIKTQVTVSKENYSHDPQIHFLGSDSFDLEKYPMVVKWKDLKRRRSLSLKKKN